MHTCTFESKTVVGRHSLHQSAFHCLTFCLLTFSGLLSKSKGEVLTIAGINRAMSLVLSDDYPNNLGAEDAFQISKDDAKCAWNYVNLTTRQRIYFENDPVVIRLCSEMLGWNLPTIDEEQDSDSASKIDDEDDMVRGRYASERGQRQRSHRSGRKRIVQGSNVPSTPSFVVCDGESGRCPAFKKRSN
jgi:hypothetical protein